MLYAISLMYFLKDGIKQAWRKHVYPLANLTKYKYKTHMIYMKLVMLADTFVPQTWFLLSGKPFSLQPLLHPSCDLQNLSIHSNL